MNKEGHNYKGCSNHLPLVTYILGCIGPPHKMFYAKNSLDNLRRGLLDNGSHELLQVDYITVNV